MPAISMVLPVKVLVDKKYIRLNLNWYRNAHHHINNKAKKAFKSEVSNVLGEWVFEPLRCISIRLTYIPSNNRKFDIDNVDSVVRKYLLDALQEFGVIEEDNYEHVVKLTAMVGQHDYEADDHYVIVEIYEDSGR